VSLWRVDDAEEAMFKSYEVSSGITIISTFLLAWLYAGQLSLATLVAVGVALAVAFNPLTSYATSAKSKRVQTISAATRFGPASVILEGLSLGYLSSVWALFVIVSSLTAAILVYSYDFPSELKLWAVLGGVVLSIIWIARGQMRGHLVEGFFLALWTMVFALFLISMHEVPDTHRFSYILFGVTLIGVGMLSHTGNNVSMDTFGPISDNANGIGELAGMSPQARQIMADLDAAGNTTKAITKGVAIGSAVIAAVSLFGSFFSDIQRVDPTFEEVVNLANPTVFVGLLIGGSLPLLFSGLLIKAVNRAAGLIMAEVRQQLRDPEIAAGTKTPDYARAVTISTQSAQTELVPVGLIAVLTPITVGFLLKEQALGGFLAGVILSGQLLAVFMSNAGGAWDNAKKYIEDGYYGGKHSENHKASVVGDTVGDPLKDTAGPALNPMIKVMNLVALICAPIVVEYEGYSAGLLIGVAVAISLIVWAVRRSDREDKTLTQDVAERVTADMVSAD
jgi:K(+)-stimulated pyrophosphate-energized sodium pump